jgi:membrane-bound lytic murein transglycosylase D
MKSGKSQNFVVIIVAALVLQFIYLEIRISTLTNNYVDQNYDLSRKMEMLEYQLETMQSHVQMVEKRSYVNTHRLDGIVVFAGDTLDLSDPIIRERMEREFFALLGNQGQIQLYLKRMSKFFPTIESGLRKAGLPDDLKYLAVHESALLNHIRSRASAVGIWQFMRATGKLYRLTINRNIDERRDPEKATAAAVRLLNDLHKYFSDWPLAMAAYNAGQGRVKRAMRDQKVDNYFDLNLPDETERYYFKIVATKLILENHDAFGFYLEEEDQYVRPKLRKIAFRVKENSISVSRLAELCSMSMSEMKKWNPSFIGNYISRGTYEIRIPEDRYPGFAMNYSEYSGVQLASAGAHEEAGVSE